MVYTRFVEVGRVVLLQRDSYAGKLAVIAEIVDHNRVVVDCPSTGVPRHVASIRHLSLTKLTVEKLPRASSSKTVQKRFEEQEISKKWSQGATAKKDEQRKRRSELSDFDRFKVMVLQKRRSRIVKA